MRDDFLNFSCKGEPVLLCVSREAVRIINTKSLHEPSVTWRPICAGVQTGRHSSISDVFINIYITLTLSHTHTAQHTLIPPMHLHTLQDGTQAVSAGVPDSIPSTKRSIARESSP